MITISGIAADNSLYPIEKMRAHQEGLLHLAISVFIFSGEHLLIQQRAKSKYHSGGQWANTCCSHPNWGEAAEDCAPRRLHEELGFRVPLAKSGIVEYEADVGNGLRECERVHIFHGHASRLALKVEPNPDEVADYRWLLPSTISQEMASAPETFTPWFKLYMQRWPDLCLPAA